MIICNAVHPHACGENTRCPLLARGCVRFTPTRVGKTTDTVDHRPLQTGSPPRVWGKRTIRDSNSSAILGSPPRVWGKRSDCPACCQAPAVHPHACGENTGTQDTDGLFPRFTPTRVGKTPGVWFTNAPETVHPHACGENPMPLRPGSPGLRFTPTRVGKTFVAFCCFYHFPVHPHACGENLSIICASASAHGSPPRVWGKLKDVPIRSGVYRFTPTRVGKTRLASSIQAATSVHPHACGENEWRQIVGNVKFGSPPRVWGKLLDIYNEVYQARFTPTRVGKTPARSH